MGYRFNVSARDYEDQVSEINELSIKSIDDQTIMFWTLQLQFMEMDIRDLLSMYISIKSLPTYIENSHTSKMNGIMDNESRFWSGNKEAKPTEDDRQCLLTHISLQLSGLA
jgi:hypothetical protein